MGIRPISTCFTQQNFFVSPTFGANLIIDDSVKAIINKKLIDCFINDELNPKLKTPSEIDGVKACEDLEEVFPKLTKKIKGTFKLEGLTPLNLEPDENLYLAKNCQNIFSKISKLVVSYEKGNTYYTAIRELQPTDLLPVKGKYKSTVKKIVTLIQELTKQKL